MKCILRIDDKDFVADAPIFDGVNAKKRRAARAVLIDEAGQVYLLNVSKHGYHKLPGGGIKHGETVEQALERELMEEMGCKAKKITELGTIKEYRASQSLLQTSYCFLAKQVGPQTDSALEDDEIEDGMFEVKAPSIEDAIQLFKKDTPKNLEGQFIQKRDLAILEVAKEYL